MRTNIEDRACALAKYILDKRTTVRSAAAHFGISKSTVHMEVTK
jgi:putative DeoR family transcriptional regulator (stage III sporulation protein D)